MPANKIARWDGTAWRAMGSGVQGGTGAFAKLAVLANGDLILGGDFSSIDGMPANYIARWDGTTWSPLGAGTGGPVTSLAALPDGGVVVGGGFVTAGGVAANRVARWDAAGWSPLGAGFDQSVWALTVLRNGDVVAGGTFTSSGGVAVNRVARWSGTSWSAMGAGLGAPAPPWATSIVWALGALPDGDVVAGGEFYAVGGGATYLSRWNGASWSPVANGPNNIVHALATLPTGAIAVGGLFTHVDGVVSSCFAHLVPTCPAAVTSTGIGCTGSGGQAIYEPLDLPWIGSTWRGQGANLPAQALVAVVTGFSATSMPLASLLSPSPANCSLLVAPDLVDFAIANANRVSTQIAIPDTVSLAGFTLHRQLVLVELSAQLAIVESTSSNALALTIGVL